MFEVLEVTYDENGDGEENLNHVIVSPEMNTGKAGLRMNYTFNETGFLTF